MNSRSTWNGPAFVQLRSSGESATQTENLPLAELHAEEALASSAHIEGRRSGALEHHTARLVARLREESHRDDGSCYGTNLQLVLRVDAGRTREPRAKRELIYEITGAHWDQSRPRESACLCYRQAMAAVAHLRRSEALSEQEHRAMTSSYAAGLSTLPP